MTTQEELTAIITDLLEQQDNRATATFRRAPGEFTNKDLREHLNCGETRARNLARKLLKAGLAEPVYVKNLDDWGRVRTVAGYRLLNHQNGDT